MFAGLFQTCYVTRDLDLAMRTLACQHGIREFRVRRDVAALPGMPEMSFHQAHVFVGTMQIELIQPAGGSDAIYRDFCPADPAAMAFHHVGMWTEPQRYAGLRAAAQAQGLPVAFEITLPVGGALYVDARATLGHYLEYVCMAEPIRARYYADVPVHRT